MTRQKFALAEKHMLALGKTDLQLARKLQLVGVPDRRNDGRNFVRAHAFGAEARQPEQYGGVGRMTMPGKRKRTEKFAYYLAYIRPDQ